MKKRIWILIPLFAILLSGCITIRAETQIKKDGSGTNSIILAFDKSMLSTVESMAKESGEEVGDIWAEARTVAEGMPGAKVEDYSEEDAEGIKISIPFSDLDEFVELSGGGDMQLFETITVTQEGDVWTLRGTIATADSSLGLGESMEGFDVESTDLADMDIEFTYSIEVEGEILTYAPKDIAQIEGSKVTWDLVQAGSEMQEVMIEWEPGGLDVLRIALIGVAGFGVLLALIGVIMTVRGRPSRRRYR